MTITAETIVEVGKVISAILCIIGIPVGCYQFVKRWTKKLFDKIDSLEDSVNSLRDDVESLKNNSDSKFSALSEEIKELKSSNKVFYSVISSVVDILYRKDPTSSDLEKTKSIIQKDLVEKATHGGGV